MALRLAWVALAAYALVALGDVANSMYEYANSQQRYVIVMFRPDIRTVLVFDVHTGDITARSTPRLPEAPMREM